MVQTQAVAPMVAVKRPKGPHLYQSRAQKGGEVVVFDLLQEAAKHGAVLSVGLRDKYLKDPTRVPPEWLGKVILFAPDGGEEDDIPTVPCLILLTPEPRAGHEFQKKKVNNSYAVAIS